MLSALMDLYGIRFYVIAELYALHAFKSESMLAVKLRSLVHLDNTGKRLLESTAVNGLDRYYSQTLVKLWKSKFSVKKTTELSTMVISRESAGKFITK